MPDYLTIARRALDLPPQTGQSHSLDLVLKGLAVELWSDAVGRLFIVADEEDARRLGQPRGTVYTAAEVQRVIRIGDPDIVRKVHEWKRTFDGPFPESGK